MANIYLAVGTVTCTASAVARSCADLLRNAGHDVTVDEQASVAALNAAQADAVLIVTATTGKGDIPNNLLNFYVELETESPLQNGRPFGVISLGDSSYSMTFCQAGALMEERFLGLQGAQPIPRITIDAIETQIPDDDALFWLKEWMEALF
ncbi:MAG TPA: flavodoxin [Oceanospirillales bacterium]|nr:flavodoxin [Oceanospirillaceae bacterium]HBS43140.1 flavodoxin [Oceanospirillales bacterium]|tara:strand:+ start:1765 stop:2217 length:453 start_codon:yes stop_codon:yes gene_type:complete